MDSIVETTFHEYHFENRGENIMTKPQLLAIGDRFEDPDRCGKAARRGVPIMFGIEVTQIVFYLFSAIMLGCSAGL